MAFLVNKQCVVCGAPFTVARNHVDVDENRTKKVCGRKQCWNSRHLNLVTQWAKKNPKKTIETRKRSVAKHKAKNQKKYVARRVKHRIPDPAHWLKSCQFAKLNGLSPWGKL